jgi:hypothetical protein
LYGEQKLLLLGKLIRVWRVVFVPATVITAYCCTGWTAACSVRFKRDCRNTVEFEQICDWNFTNRISRLCEGKTTLPKMNFMSWIKIE